MTEAVNIVRLEASNVKRLSAVRIEPNAGPGMVTVGGRNAQGKSSVLDAIQMALGGARAMPPEPINTEAVKMGNEIGERAQLRIVARLSNGLVITRTRRDGGGDYLTVTTHDGGTFRSPQAMLDSLYDALSFDPLAFTRMKPKEQREQLMRLCGLNFTQMDEDKRTLQESSRDSKTRLDVLAAAVRQELPPKPEPVMPVGDLELALEAKEHANRKWGEAQQAIVTARTKADTAIAEVSSIESQVKQLREQLAAAEKRLMEREHARDKLIAFRDQMEAGATDAPHNDEDLKAARAAIRAAIEGAAAAKAHAEAAAKREQQIKARDAEAAKLEELKGAMKSLEQQRLRALLSARYPVAGLGLGEDGVTWGNRPLQQASQAEQLRVSVAMGLAGNPGLRVMLVREGALLDDDSMKVLAELAAEHQAQVWVERVGDDGACSIVMEDGEVAVDRTEAGKVRAAEPKTLSDAADAIENKN